MRKLFYLGFSLALLMGLGCAITEYPTIIDSYTGEMVNTNGKAKIVPSSQIATIWSDGADCLYSMVDQKADGDQGLETYNFYTTGGTYWFDNQYCHPDWNGCSIVSSNSPHMDPIWFDDFRINYNCDGLRSLSYLIAVTDRYYYSECGRMGTNVLDFANTMTQVNNHTLTINLNRNNTSVHFGDNNIPVYGQNVFTVYLDGAVRSTLKLSPLARHTLNALKAHSGQSDLLSVTVNGIEFSRNMHVR
jgi:hypothetical protein